MPSIPQPLLWISLVVLWLFVLVPMLINKRDTVRRTSDVALATRVLSTRLLRRNGPAAGHRHDPTWRRGAADMDPTFDSASESDLLADVEAEFGSRFVSDATPGDDALTEQFVVAEFATEEVFDGATSQSPARARTRSLVVIAAVAEQSDPNYLDVEFVEESSGALPIGPLAGVQGSLFEDGSDQPVETQPAAPVDCVVESPDVAGSPAVAGSPDVAESLEDVGEAAEAVEAEEAVVGESVSGATSGSSSESEPVSAAERDLDPGADYEYVEDTSGLEAAEEPQAPGRRRRLDSTATAAAVSVRKYRFRKRVLTALAAIMMLTAVLSFSVSSTFWWSCGSTGVVTVLYLAYLRRQTRIEE